MKKFLSKGLGFLVLVSLFTSATPVVAVGENPDTTPATNVATNTVTLNGINGTSDAANVDIWWGSPSALTVPFTPAVDITPQVPSGWSHTGIGSSLANQPFHYNVLLGLTDNTAYSFVTWSQVA